MLTMFAYAPGGGGGGSSNSFTIMQPVTGTAPTAGSSTDTLTFAVGTAGTDFGIAGNSGTKTLTFNIPTSASGVRGLLSGAAFNSFSAKQTSSLASNKIWIGNGTAQPAGAHASSGDIHSFTFDGSASFIATVNSVNGHVFDSAGTTATSIVGRDSFGGITIRNLDFSTGTGSGGYGGIGSCTSIGDWDGGTFATLWSGAATVYQLNSGDGFNTISIDLKNRIMKDSSGLYTIDYGARHLNAYSTENVTLDWGSAGDELKTPVIFTQYNNETTAAVGLPYIVGYVSENNADLTTFNRDVFTPSTDGLYEVWVAMEITTVGSLVDIQLNWASNLGSETKNMMSNVVTNSTGTVINEDGSSPPYVKSGSPIAIIFATSGTPINVRASNNVGGGNANMKAIVKRVV